MSTQDRDKSGGARAPAPGAAPGSVRQPVPPRPPEPPTSASASPASPQAPASSTSPRLRNAAPLPEADPPLSLVEDPPPKDLVLEDTAALRKRGMPVGADPVSGYNPYDAGPPAGGRTAREPSPAPKRTDLRKLSEWIRTQRRVEDLKKGGNEDGE